MIAAKQWAPDKPLPDPGAVPDACAAGLDAQGDELRADQARRADAAESRLARKHRQHRRASGRKHMNIVRTLRRGRCRGRIIAVAGLGAGAGADQDHRRQGGRRRRPAHSELHRDGQGLLQGRRPRRALRRAGGPAADDGGAVRQPRFRPDPVRRRAGGAEAAPSSATSSASRSSRSGSSSPSRRSRRSRTSRARRWATPASAPPTTTRARPRSSASST